MLGFTASATAVDALVTAAVGQPYGVAVVEIPVAQPEVGRELPPLRVTSDDNRVLYPVSDAMQVEVDPPVRRPTAPTGRARMLRRAAELAREMARPAGPRRQTVARRVSFLIRGDAPLRIELDDADGPIGSYDIELAEDRAALDALKQTYWNAYTTAAQQQLDAADYPPAVETYLVAMLAGRLQLPLPNWYTAATLDDDDLTRTLKLIAGGEELGEAVFRDTAAGLNRDGAATVPLPPPPRWAPLFEQSGLEEVTVEPLAQRVPPECFYLRYGSFENYLWFTDLSAEYGGDITQMIQLRGIESPSFGRIETQLNVKTTAMSRLLGPQVIADQAIIGRDIFTADGASIGVLFQANNRLLLRTSFHNERTVAARQDETLTLQPVEIGGHPGTLLSSADNRVRSFLVEDGDFILITNSRALAERFIEVGEGGESLADTAAFRLSRQLMPVERNDTIFAYFSPAMLRGLVAPEYLIELRRRLQARASIELVHLARLAARQEYDGRGDEPPRSVDALIAAGFLPAEFAARPDGSGVITVGPDVMDALRGRRGYLLPIADVPIEQVTANEAAWYGEIADRYSQQFPTIDPIMVGVQRQSAGQGDQVEQISIHAEVAPWEPEKYGDLAQWLGPPTQVAMQFAPDDIVAVQAHVAAPQLGPPTHLFAGVKDTVPPDPEEFDGLLNIYRALRGLPAYLGAWPQPGALDRLPFGLGQGRPVGPGMNRLIGGLYRYTDGAFSVLSFQPQVIESALPHLAAVEDDNAAQIRVRVGNPVGSQLEAWVNQQLYQRAAAGSDAGARFLNLLSRQLSVDPEQAQTTTERILGAPLQCPLGGEYEYSESPLGWRSTAWSGMHPDPQPPPDYRAPALTWFRGASAAVTQYADRVVADLSIEIARQNQ